jgi:hypothetical protein
MISKKSTTMLSLSGGQERSDRGFNQPQRCPDTSGHRSSD